MFPIENPHPFVRNLEFPVRILRDRERALLTGPFRAGWVGDEKRIARRMGRGRSRKGRGNDWLGKRIEPRPVTAVETPADIESLVATAEAKPETLASMKASYEQAKENVRQLQEAGITLAVGTDAGTGFAPMGLVTHEEIAAFVDAGLSPMEALVAATRGSAQWAGVSDRVGTLEAGKLADMVILEQSPLLDIRNTRKIVQVILGGRAVDPLSRAR